MNGTELFFLSDHFPLVFVVLYYNAFKIFDGFLFDSATELRVLSYGVFCYVFTAGVSPYEGS